MRVTESTLRRIAADAHANVMRPDEIAADLASVQRRIAAGEGAQPVGVTVRPLGDPPRRGWRIALVGAVAVAAIAVVVGVVLTRDRGSDRIQSPGTAGTAGVTTTPSTAPTTAPAPAGGPIAVDAADPPPLVQPTPFVTLSRHANPDGQAIEVAIGIGRIAVRQPGDDHLTLIDTTDRGGTVPSVTSVPLDEQLTNLVLGPGDVVYGVGDPRLSSTEIPEAFRMVAIALSGDRSGHVIAEADLDPVTYTELPVGAFGHGLLGIVDRSRNVNAEIMRYADPDGNTLGLGPGLPPLLTWTPAIAGASGTVTNTVTGTTWDLAVTVAPTHGEEYLGLSPPMPTSGGRVVYTLRIGADLSPDSDFGSNAMPVVAILEPDGSGRWIRLPDDWTVAASDLSGTVLMRTTTDSVELALLDDVLAATVTLRGPGSLTRPILAIDGCRSTSARGPAGFTVDGAFARPTSQPAVTQVFGNPADPYGSRFVIVQRFFSEQRVAERPAPGQVTVNPSSGRSSADWILPDGSEIYVNSRDVSEADLVAIVQGLVARPLDAAVPGVDLVDPAVPLTLLDEALGTVAGINLASSSCTLEDGRQVMVAVLGGRPLGRFIRLLDSPSPLPAAHTLDDGTTLIVSSPGGDFDLDAALATVHQATPEQWEELRGG